MTRLLDVQELTTDVVTPARVIRPVDGVSFRVDAGEAVAIVGESGSGKSMTMLSVLQLLPPGGRIRSGKVNFNATDLTGLAARQLRNYRGKEIGVIFQDPMTFLNPIQRIGIQVCEAISLHAPPRSDARKIALDTLARVGIPSPGVVFDYFPHQLSGGMRQRVLIAIAIACNPRLLIADEPTTALDVTTQAQIMTLLRDLRQDMGSSLILITHDLGLVAEYCDRVYVMYAGKIVEECTADQLFEAPRHPYTRALLRSILTADRRSDLFQAIPGQPPDLRHMPGGCRFHPRCDVALAKCATEAPPSLDIGADRKARCWLYAEGEI